MGRDRAVGVPQFLSVQDTIELPTCALLDFARSIFALLFVDFFFSFHLATDLKVIIEMLLKKLIFSQIIIIIVKY